MTALYEHTGPWTIEDIAALPNQGDHNRYELLAPGVLTVSAAPEPIHQRASRRLANLLEMAAAAAGMTHLEVLEAVNVVIPASRPRRLCVPDIAIVDRQLADETTVNFPPGSVVAVVEIVSPSTHATDRIIKPDLYAAAEVPIYVRLELDPRPELHVSQLRLAGRHEHLATVLGGRPGHVPGLPFPAEVDPARLVSRP